MTYNVWLVTLDGKGCNEKSFINKAAALEWADDMAEPDDNITVFQYKLKTEQDLVNFMKTWG